MTADQWHPERAMTHSSALSGWRAIGESALGFQPPHVFLHSSKPLRRSFAKEVSHPCWTKRPAGHNASVGGAPHCPDSRRRGSNQAARRRAFVHGMMSGMFPSRPLARGDSGCCPPSLPRSSNTEAHARWRTQPSHAKAPGSAHPRYVLAASDGARRLKKPPRFPANWIEIRGL